MRKALLAIFAIFLMLGSLMVFIPNASACHNKTVSCSPTEKDIIDIETYMIDYEIDVYLTPGCGNQYWVGFTANSPKTGWDIKLYEKGDSTKTSLLYPSDPPTSGFDSWAGWHAAGSGSVHFYAILEVKVTDTNTVENGDFEIITVHCWSKDNVPNDLEDDPVTTTTTLNIPHGIRMKHTAAYDATQYVYPGNWATFDITVLDIGNASGLVNLSKGTTSSPCLEDDWEWEFSANPVEIVTPEGSVRFTLKVKPPLTADYGDFSIFIAEGVAQANPEKFKHSVSAKTIVTIPLPDISIKSKDMCCLETEPCDGDTVTLSIDVYNLGDIDVTDFEITFKLTDPGHEEDIGELLIEETLKPNKWMNVQYEWVAIEGDHSICAHVDEKKLIQEKDEEGNNEAGMIVSVGPAKPKSIILTAAVSPTTVMPKAKFTVSGKATYNKDFNYNPVASTNVNVKVINMGTSKLFTGNTDTNGEYSIECDAPDKEGIFDVEISISKEGISASKSDYITVSTFIVDVGVQPRPVITGNDFKVSGRVTDKSGGIKTAGVTIELLDGTTVKDTVDDAETDQDGFYTVTMTAPMVTKKSSFDIKVKAQKDLISGIAQTYLDVDIDTDSDSIADTLDDDKDGDGYTNVVEVEYGTDEMDKTDFPGPVAVINLKGDITTFDEGQTVELLGTNSYSAAALELIYEWNLGDGSDIIKGKEENKPEHVYKADGTYKVTLTVYDSIGKNDTTDVTLTINDLGPTVEIKGDETGEAGTVLTFNADVVSPQDSISSYDWDFGDGTTGTGESITHTWTIAGEFTVKVKVIDSDSSTAEDEFTVTVSAKPDDSKPGSEDEEKEEGSSDMTMIAIIIIIVIVVLLVLMMLLRRKKPETQDHDGRVADNLAAQSSRRPTTEFADANIKPAMGAAPTQKRMAVPGTVPQRPVVGPAQQQVQHLPPAPTTLQPTNSNTLEQKDWNWDFNE
jgi:hypothetical protein